MRRPPRSTRTATLFPSTTLCRADPSPPFLSRPLCSSSAPLHLAVNPPSARAIGRKSTDRVNGGPRHPYHRRRTRGLRSRLAARRGGLPRPTVRNARRRSEEHASELQSLMRISYAVFCLKNKNP